MPFGCRYMRIDHLCLNGFLPYSHDINVVLVVYSQVLHKITPLVAQTIHLSLQIFFKLRYLLIIKNILV